LELFVSNRETYGAGLTGLKSDSLKTFAMGLM
jgi:hypothetical protein